MHGKNNTNHINKSYVLLRIEFFLKKEKKILYYKSPKHENLPLYTLSWTIGEMLLSASWVDVNIILKHRLHFK